jgi:succinoglycan biosynthesis transport protein ExoP
VPWEVPTAPGVSVGPHVLLNVIFALVAALFVGCGLAILLERLDTTLKNEEDARKRIDLPVLGSVSMLRNRRGKPARVVEAISLSDPLDHRAESFRMIRTNLLFSEVDKPLRTLVVTSWQPGEGKTSVACNLAITLAQAGKRVILVDADLRSPGIQNVFHRRTSLPGLGNLILGQITPEEMAAPRPLPTLQVVYSGLRPPNPSDLFGSSTMADVLRRLGGLADLVILDTPPIDVVTDATVLAAQADGVLLVVDSRRTPLDAVVRAQHKLVAVNANVLGIVLNKVKRHAPDASYHRYYAPAPVDQSATNGHTGVVPPANGSRKLQPQPARGESMSSPRR